jgi:hypothetical protein
VNGDWDDGGERHRWLSGWGMGTQMDVDGRNLRGGFSRIFVKDF